MRLMILAATTALLMLPAATASAQTPTVASEFQRYCIANRTDMPKAVPLAKAQGFADYPATKPSNVDTMWGLRKVDATGEGWAFVVTQSKVAGTGAAPNQTYEACNITGPLGAPASKAAVKTWIGIAPNSETPTKINYVYSEKAGKRTAIVGSDDATMIAALNSGGFYVLQIEDTEGKTGMTLLRVQKAP